MLTNGASNGSAKDGEDQDEGASQHVEGFVV